MHKACLHVLAGASGVAHSGHNMALVANWEQSVGCRDGWVLQCDMTPVVTALSCDRQLAISHLCVYVSCFCTASLSMCIACVALCMSKGGLGGTTAPEPGSSEVPDPGPLICFGIASLSCIVVWI
jgi:hypothetical protein